MFDTFTTIDCGGRPLALDRPRIMAIVNVTPDSFSDGGQYASVDAAVAHALRLAQDGADILERSVMSMLNASVFSVRL